MDYSKKTTRSPHLKHLALIRDNNGCIKTKKAMDDIDVVEKLNIEPLVNKYRCPTLVESYTAQHINAKKPKIDPGLRKGYLWLLNYIIRRYGDINLRVQTDIHADLERRKRMLNKASNRASQTSTAVSDDIATQTGFENPNFNPNSQNSDGKDIGRMIIVKPIEKSGDTTMTIESIDTDNTSVKPKLSPLFGRSSDSSHTEVVKIELESRSEFRKLSPIVRSKSGSRNHIDFVNRPQSSPTFKKHNKVGSSSKNSSSQDEDLKEIQEIAQFGEGNVTWDGVREKKHRVLVTDAELSHMHREIVLTERDYGNKTAVSDVVLQAATLPLSARPASASQLVRRQLEISAQHKRRLSLRYMHRNKTSPDRVSMLVYEPKAPQRHLDKGDFDHTSVN